jgi:purine-binding chemotaxis protein CheW
MRAESTVVAANVGRDMLTFDVGAERYALDIGSVQEILKRRALTEVPRAPAFLLGIVSVRGVVLPVLDLAARLGQGATPPSASGRILVVRRNEERFGLLVDRVQDVLSPQASEIEPPPPGLGGEGSFLLGLCRPRGHVGAPIILLDLAALLRFDLAPRLDTAASRRRAGESS